MEQPKRLRDDEIERIIIANATAFVEPAELAMAVEIQERRAADLNPTDIECIKHLRAVDLHRYANAQPYRDALDKILRAHGLDQEAKP